MNTKNNNLIPRPPVVVIMGHIDHGKSTLLDYIRKTNKVAQEEGGITQKISAYEAECEVADQKRKITFLDTPGHEAFCAVRERGARVADIAVLVVSAEDGVKPQTLEALNCIKKDSMPFVIALSKIDKPGANIDKIKQNLAENNIMVEGWGGTIPLVPLSSKTGEGVSELLEMITLQSDIEGLKSNPSLAAEGFVIESGLNPQQGISATIIIKEGTLKTGMFVATDGAYAKVRVMKNFKGEDIEKASFSSPIKIVGWSNQPAVGRQFKSFAAKEEAVAFANATDNLESGENQVDIPEGCASLPLVLKADNAGSLEAVEYELEKLGGEKIMVKIIGKGVGAITEKDVKMASVKKSLVIGFNVSTDKSTEMLAMRDKVEIKTFKVIYELVDYLKEKVKEATPTEMVEKVTGSAKILKTFSQNKDRQIVGGKVEEGEIKSGSTLQIWRRDSTIGEGKIKELQVKKVKTGTAEEGQEFGMMIDSKTEIVGGDVLKIVSLVKE